MTGKNGNKASSSVRMGWFRRISLNSATQLLKRSMTSRSFVWKRGGCVEHQLPDAREVTQGLN